MISQLLEANGSCEYFKDLVDMLSMGLGERLIHGNIFGMKWVRRKWNKESQEFEPWSNSIKSLSDIEPWLNHLDLSGAYENIFLNSPSFFRETDFCKCIQHRFLHNFTKHHFVKNLFSAVPFWRASFSRLFPYVGLLVSNITSVKF